MAILYVDGKRLLRTFRASAHWLLANEQELNDINVFPVPDGDTGTNMGATLKSIIGALENDNASLEDVATTAARAALTGARGNSGVILSQIFRGFSDGVGTQKRLRAVDIADALTQAYTKAYAAVSDPREGTILTVVRESAEAAAVQATKDDDIITMIEVLCREARRSLMRTPELLPALKEAGVVDAGGMGYVYFIEGILKLLKGEHLPNIELIRNTSNPAENKGVSGNVFYGYCNELFIHNATASLQEIRTALQDKGDSLVIAGEATLVKVHIHSRYPDQILKICLSWGIVSGIKIENMDEQHVARSVSTANTTLKESVVIAIALGDGLHDILRSLGCDYVISGGQTMNPSVENILDALQKFKARHYYILPNNGNVIAAAEQVAHMVTDISVTVIPSKNIPEGCVALLAFDPDQSPEKNVVAMTQIMASVSSGEITTAARTTVIQGISITHGDIIALADKKMVGSYDNPTAAVGALVEDMVTDESAVISLYYGADISVSDAESVQELLESRYAHFDIEMHYGGQPHYYYLVSVE